jgi:hypothetical protein
MKRKSPDSSSLAIELVGKIGQKFDGTNKWWKLTTTGISFLMLRKAAAMRRTPLSKHLEQHLMDLSLQTKHCSEIWSEGVSTDCSEKCTYFLPLFFYTYICHSHQFVRIQISFGNPELHLSSTMHLVDHICCVSFSLLSNTWWDQLRCFWLACTFSTDSKSESVGVPFFWIFWYLLSDMR